MPAPLLLTLRWLTLVAVLVLAAWVRTHALSARPMHADEANQAVKLGELLETGRYTYDPRDHHGPTLYYAAVPIAWLRGERTLVALTETTVRLVPAVAGTFAVLFLAWLAQLGWRGAAADRAARRSPQPPPWSALAAAGFLAVSPPAVYYSRYYVQETLLVTFTLGALLCLLHAWRTRRVGWAVGAGIFLGLMQATKASAPLFLAAALIAAALARRLASGATLASRLQPPAPPSTPPHPPVQTGRRLVLAAAIAAAVTAALLFSGFGTSPRGLWDAFAAYGHAIARFGAGAAATGHEKSWSYYLQLFGWQRNGGLVFHQVPFSLLVLAGLALALRRRQVDPFLAAAAAYALLVIAAFSALAYKTPWHAVHFVPPFALLAAGTLRSLARLRTGKPVAAAFGLITLATLFQQTQWVAFLRPADQRNPYAYVHSTPDVQKYRSIALEARDAHPDQPIRVISEEYWPLPWYLRGLPVGYYMEPPADCDGSLVIVSATQYEVVRERLRGRYTERFLGLRPGVICILFVAEP